MANVPDGLKYTREHEWVRLDGAAAVVGITDYAQDKLGEIVYLELPKPGAPLQAMKPFGTIESVKAASDLYSPVNGVVLEVNAELNKAPEHVNQDPYGRGWIIKLTPADPKQLDALLDAAAYRELLASP
jgi:glycine cleavage system H protein